METLLSLIIPIYKTEKFIEKCLESVCQQSLAKFEIIIVDDCSPDDSVEIVNKILDKYPSRKEQTILISLDKNQGLPNARKTGLAAAKGKYIASLDSDDYLELNALELMLNKIQEQDSDILVCDYFFSAKKNDFYIKQTCSSSPEDFLKKLLTGELQGFWWNKLYKRTLLDKIHIYPDIHMQEDILVAIQMGFISTRITYLPKAIVHYIQYNTNSMTKNYTEKSISDLLFVMDWIDTNFKKKNNYSLFSEYINHRRYLMKSDIITYSSNRKQYFSLYEKELLEHKEVVKLSLYKKVFIWLVKKKLYIGIEFLLLFRKLKWILFYKYY